MNVVLACEISPDQDVGSKGYSKELKATSSLMLISKEVGTYFK